MDLHMFAQTWILIGLPIVKLSDLFDSSYPCPISLVSYCGFKTKRGICSAQMRHNLKKELFAFHDICKLGQRE